MSQQGGIDLDSLILKDKAQAKNRHTHHIQKKRQQARNRRHQLNKRKFHDHRQRNNRHLDRRFEHPKHNERIGKFYEDKPQFQNQVYALSVHGFVSDVSIEGILSLNPNRKILGVKTLLKRKDKGPIDPVNDTEIQVVIIFAQKNDADSFIKEYSERVLDGKHSLSFSFVTPFLD